MNHHTAYIRRPANKRMQTRSSEMEEVGKNQEVFLDHLSFARNGIIGDLHGCMKNQPFWDPKTTFGL